MVTQGYMAAAFFVALAAAAGIINPAAQAAETVTLELSRRGESSKTLVSLEQLYTQAGDEITVRSEYGETYSFRVESATRSLSGNKIIVGFDDNGARLNLVASPDGAVEGAIRDGFASYRLNAVGGELLWSRGDPALARRADGGAIRKRRPPGQLWPAEMMLRESAQQSRVQKSTHSSEITYPQFASGKAVIDVLFYYEAGMATPDVVIDAVTLAANQAMVDSGIDLQINTVGLRPLDIDPDVLQEDLLDHMFEAEAPFDDIARDRAFYEADLVIALRENIPDDDDACGVAYVGVYEGAPWRDLYMATVQWLPIEAPGNTYCSDTTTAHEIGHILGSQHERRIAEEGDVGAYSYSFGHYEDGVFHTIMSYGDEAEAPFFSNPNIRDCGGGPCGVPAGDPRSADNARGFTQTRFMLAGYESTSLASELIRDFVIDETCELDEGGEGRRKGHGISNDTPHSIYVQSLSVLTAAGQVLTNTFSEERALDSGYFLQPSCGPAGDDSPYGVEYVESWVTYEDRLSGKLVESLHLRWDDSYEGSYARVDVATHPGGTVSGHTSKLVLPDETLVLQFEPEPTYRLEAVESSCGGSLSGNTFSLSSVDSDCRIEPRFESVLAPEERLEVLLEEPGASAVYSGIGNLRGWSVATAGIERIEIWIDGVYAFDAPYGGTRGDVGNIFPEIPGAGDSGFSLAWNYNNMALGDHTITARAINNNGDVSESSSRFTVTRFHKPFIQPSDVVDLSAAQCSVFDTQIQLGDAVIDGQIYDILLDWRTAAQDFQIIEIR